jgi:hypothetical protein
VFFSFFAENSPLCDQKKNAYEDPKAKITEDIRKFASFLGILSGTRQF